MGELLFGVEGRWLCGLGRWRDVITFCLQHWVLLGWLGTWIFVLGDWENLEGVEAVVDEVWVSSAVGCSLVKCPAGREQGLGNASSLRYVQQFWSGFSGPCSPIVQAETIKFSLVWISTATCAAGSTCTRRPAEFSSWKSSEMRGGRFQPVQGWRLLVDWFVFDRLVFTVVSVCLSSQKLNSGKAWQQKAENTSFIRYLQWRQIADPSYRKKHLYWRKHLKILTKL